MGRVSLHGLTYQLDGTRRRSLVGALLDVEEKAGTGLTGPRSNIVGNLGRLLRLDKRRQNLGLDGVGPEPEKPLGIDEVPA